MQPTIGRIVHVKLTKELAERAHMVGWEKGFNNPHEEGQNLPAIITRIWPDEYGPGIPGINVTIFPDGNGTLWATSLREGTEPGTWCWPPRS